MALKKLCEKFQPAEPPAEKSPLAPSTPCPTCGGGFFWRSVYGDELRCADCSPWPNATLRRDLWLVVVEDDGSLGWELIRDRTGRVGGFDVADQVGLTS